MRLWGLLLAFAIVSCKGSADVSPSATASVAAGREQDDAAIRSAFASYIENGMAKKGEAVAALVSESTFTYYERMRDAALTEPAVDLRRRSLAEQVIILAMRRDMPLDKLHEASGREIVIHNINADGLADSANKSSITTIRFIGENEALASMIVASKSAPDALRAVREGGMWKVDPPSLAQTMNQFFKNAVNSGEMSEHQALLMMLGEADEAAVQRLFEPVAGH